MQAIGLGVAVDYLSQAGMAATHQAERDHRIRRPSGCRRSRRSRILGPSADKRGGLAAFTLDAPIRTTSPRCSITWALPSGQAMIALSRGTERLDLPATARASLYPNPTKEAVDSGEGTAQVVETPPSDPKT